MADGTPTFNEVVAAVARVDTRAFQLLDTTDKGSHRDIDEPGQTYADMRAWEYGSTVTISTCEGSVDVEATDMDDLVKAYIAKRPGLRDELMRGAV